MEQYFRGNNKDSDTPDLTKLIDTRNQYFWESVQKEFSVSVVYHDEEFHMAYSKGKIAIIYIPYTGYSIEGFTHEVLHLYLKMHDLDVGSVVYVLMNSNPILHQLDLGLIEHVGNAIDHALMFTMYSKAGFKEELFLFDFHEAKCTDKEMSLIALGFGNDAVFIRKTAIECYIGKFFAMKACTNRQFNYEGYLAHLQQISPGLYLVLDNVWREVAGLTIHTKEEKGKIMIAVNFIDNLLEWVASDPVAATLKE